MDFFEFLELLQTETFGKLNFVSKLQFDGKFQQVTSGIKNLSNSDLANFLEKLGKLVFLSKLQFDGKGKAIVKITLIFVMT